MRSSSRSRQEAIYIFFSFDTLSSTQFFNFSSYNDSFPLPASVPRAESFAADFGHVRPYLNFTFSIRIQTIHINEFSFSFPWKF